MPYSVQPDDHSDSHEPRRTLSGEEFASLVTHELRNPLNAMSGWLHLLSADAQSRPEASERALAGLKRALDQQIAQVDLLGRVLRLTSGADDTVGVPVDLDAVLEDCIRALAPSARAVGREIVLQRSAGPTSWAHGDRDAIAAALKTLWAFAFRHGIPGAPLRVTLETRDGGPFMRLGIDEGAGSGISIWHAFGTGTARLALDLLHATLAIESRGGRLKPCGDGRVGDELGIAFEPAGMPRTQLRKAGERLMRGAAD